MDEQAKAELQQNALADEAVVDRSKERSLTQDSDGDGLTDREEARLGTDPFSVDTDRDGVSDLQEVLQGTDPNNLENRNDARDGNELSNAQVEAVQETPSFPPLNPFLDSKVEQSLPRQEQVSDLKPENPVEATSEAEQPPVINDLYHRLQERSNLDLNSVTFTVFQGADLLYQGNSQAPESNKLTPELQDILQKALDDPTGLRGELSIAVNGETIFHVENGELKIDQYGLADNQQVVESQSQTQSTSSKPEFDSVAYFQEVSKDPYLKNIAPIDAFEHIAQSALDDGLSVEQTKQVLSQDSFYKSFAVGLGQEQAEKYSTSLINSLSDKGKAQSELHTLGNRLKGLESSSSSDNRPDGLEERIKSLESLNQQLSSQLNLVTQKLDKLSQSKAFQAQPSGLNQFLSKVGQSIGDTLQATKNALRQKAGEVSLALVDATAKKSIQLFGEEASGGLRVIDANDGKRIGTNQQGDIWLSKSPDLQAAGQYQRLSKEVDKDLPPSLQLKQIAQVALKEQFTTPQIQSVLSQSPKFQDISSKQGVDKANQFASVAIAAAQRQNLIDARPKQQESQKQKQAQA